MIAEYDDLIRVGQTHSKSTHLKYYNFSDAAKNDRLGIARTMHETYQRITPGVTSSSQLINPPVNQDQVPELISRVTINPADEQQKQFNHLIRSSAYQYSNTPTPETMRTINDQDFGIARKDIEKEGKRFEWIDEELDYLVFYIKTIESDEKKNKYSKCLTHLRNEATAEVKQYFHPHHIASSDRLKNGYNTAMKRIVDSDQNS